MSLTSFVKRPEVRKKFREEFETPRYPRDLQLLAPPLSRRYGLVGTAFDYLLRFYLQRRNPKAIQRRWVAEQGLDTLRRRVGAPEFHYDIDDEKLSFPDDNERLSAWNEVLKRARAAHGRYIASGKVTDSLLKAVIGLAQLDNIFRIGYVDPNPGVAHREDMRDLRKLISIVKPRDFRVQKICLLNPIFGFGSRLIGGADADLVIDGMLIDIKTIKSLPPRRDDFNQLLGYFALHQIWGVDGAKFKTVRGCRKPRISQFAFYFSRYGYMHVFNVKDIIDMKTYPSFLRWFKKSIEQHYNRRKRRSSGRGKRKVVRTTRK